MSYFFFLFDLSLVGRSRSPFFSCFLSFFLVGVRGCVLIAVRPSPFSVDSGEVPQFFFLIPFKSRTNTHLHKSACLRYPMAGGDSFYFRGKNKFFPDIMTIFVDTFAYSRLGFRTY